jgi:hypothetical protein
MTENVIVDPILGELKPLDAFTHGRHVKLDGREIQLVLETGEGLTPEALTQARRFASTPADFTKRGQRFAAESLLELKNDTWQGDGESALSVGELAQQLSLEACEIAADGLARLYFASADLFAGHSVIVYVDPAGNVTDAQLSG